MMDKVRILMDRRDGLAVFIQLGLGVVRVLQWVGVQGIERDSLAAVNLIPEFTGELILIKECSIRTDKACTLGSVSAIVTHTICLTS